MEQSYTLRIIRLAQFLCLFLTFAATAQVQTARYTKIISKVNAYWEYLPQGYDPASTQTYPLILSLPGFGNMGDGSPAQMPNALIGHVASWIKNGLFPTSFTVNGQTFKFIVITPQFVRDPLPTAKDIDSVITFVVKKYRVNTKRIYLMGLSYGGGLCWDYVSASSVYANRIAAIAPSASTANLSSTRCRTVASANVPVWATHNDLDPLVPDTNTINTVNRVNLTPAPYPPAKYTIFHDTVHNAWYRGWDPKPTTTYRENSLNVYQWMLQFQRVSSTVSSTGNIAPKAKAGADQIITTPTNSVKLSGSGTDADDSITYYTWTKISGPTKGYLRSSGLAVTYAKYLVPGTYLFKLTVTDSRKATGSDTIKVIVNQAPIANASSDQTITLPTNYVTLNGSGSDANGYITSYSWSKISGPSYFTFSSTTTASTKISNLVAGSYTFRLTVKDNMGGTGYDDVVVTVKSSTTAAITMSSNSREDATTDQGLSRPGAFMVFPNPVQNQVTVQLDNSYKGKVKMQLMDMSGRMLKEVTGVKYQQQYNTSFSVGELNKGTYLINVQGENWKHTTKIIKQ